MKYIHNDYKKTLPQIIKRDLKILDKYKKKNKTIKYNSYSEGVEVSLKSLFFNNEITQKQLEIIKQEYGISL